MKPRINILVPGMIRLVICEIKDNLKITIYAIELHIARHPLLGGFRVQVISIQT
jgi:hypothetical protein